MSPCKIKRKTKDVVDRGPPSFLVNLVNMINREHDIHWDPGKKYVISFQLIFPLDADSEYKVPCPPFLPCCPEKGLVIENPKRLGNGVLGNYFRHSNFTAFQRQLHNFKFKKLTGKRRYEHSVYTNPKLIGEKSVTSLLSLRKDLRPATPLTNDEGRGLESLPRDTEPPHKSSGIRDGKSNDFHPRSGGHVVHDKRRRGRRASHAKEAMSLVHKCRRCQNRSPTPCRGKDTLIKSPTSSRETPPPMASKKHPTSESDLRSRLISTLSVAVAAQAMPEVQQSLVPVFTQKRVTYDELTHTGGISFEGSAIGSRQICNMKVPDGSQLILARQELATGSSPSIATRCSGGTTAWPPSLLNYNLATALTSGYGTSHKGGHAIPQIDITSLGCASTEGRFEGIERTSPCSLEGIMMYTNSDNRLRINWNDQSGLQVAELKEAHHNSPVFENEMQGNAQSTQHHPMLHGKPVYRLGDIEGSSAHIASVGESGGYYAVQHPEFNLLLDGPTNKVCPKPPSPNIETGKKVDRIHTEKSSGLFPTFTRNRQCTDGAVPQGENGSKGELFEVEGTEELNIKGFDTKIEWGMGVTQPQTGKVLPEESTAKMSGLVSGANLDRRDDDIEPYWCDVTELIGLSEDYMRSNDGKPLIPASKNMGE